MTRFSVGDTALVLSRYKVEKHFIARETKTLWILGDGSKFRKSDNRPQGAGIWETRSLVLFDEVMWEGELCKRKRGWLASYLWSELDDDTTNTISEMLRSVK